MQLSDLDLNGTYTYADYFKWKFEERVELIKGKIFKMSPAPSPSHQKLVFFIHVRLDSFLTGKPCQVFEAPFDVRLAQKTKNDQQVITVLQPDVCVICDPAKVDEKGCAGAPDIVVEVLSPGNNAKELKKKYEVYEESGVKEYWIVSPQNQWVRSYTLTDGKFKESPFLVSGDTLESSVLPGFTLNITELFKIIEPVE